MSTRKRSRTQEDEDLPPTKREPDLDNPEGVGVSSSPVGTGVRQGEQQARDGQVFERDEEFWFDDGTVILVACNVEFRFYKGLLACVSPVFKQLFADCRVVRTVNINQEQTFSCPVVHVSDSPEDLRYVLHTCSSKRPGRLYEEREPSYQEISAAIRLGRKYKIAELYSQSVEFLKSYFSDTLGDYEPVSFLPSGWKEVDAIGVISLARLTGELSLLPSAFVTCISAKSTGADGIVHGNIQEDGSKEHLSPNDLAICFNGKTSLLIATVSAIFRAYKPVVSPACRRQADCKAALTEVLVNFGEKAHLLLDGDPFPSYRMLGMLRGGLGMCGLCLDMVHARGRKERKDLWNRLPEVLGIDVPGWGQEPAQPPLPQSQERAT